MNNLSLSHSRYNCTYHIVVIPKYRRKIMFGNLRREVGEAISKVCKMKGVTIIKAATLLVYRIIINYYKLHFH